MQRLRDELLAGPRLPGNQYTGIRPRQQRQLPDDGAERGRRANEVVENLVPRLRGNSVGVSVAHH